MKSPLVTITVATHNMAASLPRAIRSALSQTYPSYDVLILNDGSTDATEDVLEEFRSNERVKILKHANRQGLTECRNRLLKEANGELLSILDADDVVLPGKLKAHVDRFKKQPDLGMIWGRAVVKDICTGALEVLPKEGFRHEWDLIESYQAVHSATTWKKDALVQAGGYASERTLVEDADMFLKVGDRFAQYYSPELVAVKYRNSKNEFRAVSRDAERSKLSDILMKETIYRRYSTLFLQHKNELGC